MKSRKNRWHQIHLINIPASPCIQCFARLRTLCLQSFSGYLPFFLPRPPLPIYIISHQLFFRQQVVWNLRCALCLLIVSHFAGSRFGWLAPGEASLGVSHLEYLFGSLLYLLPLGPHTWFPQPSTSHVRLFFFFQSALIPWKTHLICNATELRSLRWLLQLRKWQWKSYPLDKLRFTVFWVLRLNFRFPDTFRDRYCSSSSFLTDHLQEFLMISSGPLSWFSSVYPPGSFIWTLMDQLLESIWISFNISGSATWTLLVDLPETSTPKLVFEPLCVCPIKSPWTLLGQQFEAF